MLDITILTKYTSQGASSRYRYFFYLHELLKQDVNIEIDTFLDTSYLHRLYNDKKKSKIRILISYLKRFFVLLNSSKNLIIEYEALPYLPYVIEKIFLKNKRYILNFDDNVWVNYENNFFLNKKIDNLVKNANGIIIANKFLEKKVLKLNENVIKIPTVINLENYIKDSKIEKFNQFTLVWVGSPSTYKYIKSHENIFKKLSNIIDYKLVVIASRCLIENAIDGVNMEFYDWSAVTEVDILKKSHVGIMPLNTDAFSQGKSSFKIIQYMAAELPIVASNVGENCNVLQDNKMGFLVDNDDSWISAIVNLYKDEKLYNSFSKQSKENAYEYSIQKYFKEFNLFIQRVFDD